MKIHTDKITRADLFRELPSGCMLEVTEGGSRSRARRFDVGISAEHGTDSHGIKRAFARNTGKYGGGGSYDRAATWIEWGDWIVALFVIDPDAKIGDYESPHDFVLKTHEYAPHRPKRENAEEHANRWSATLFYAIGTPVADGLRVDHGDVGDGVMGDVVVKEYKGPLKV